MSRKPTPANAGRPAQGLQLQSVQQSFSGPLPPPAALERYNDIVPGAANRIIVMAEGQHAHRQALELRVVSANIAAQKLGVVLGFIVAMTAILGGIYLVATGKQASGLAAIIAALAALVGTFVYGRQSQRKDLDNKKPNDP
jgi:uncharacterized membrane protein